MFAVYWGEIITIRGQGILSPKTGCIFKVFVLGKKEI